MVYYGLWKPAFLFIEQLRRRFPARSGVGVASLSNTWPRALAQEHVAFLMGHGHKQRTLYFVEGSG